MKSNSVVYQTHVLVYLRLLDAQTITNNIWRVSLRTIPNTRDPDLVSSTALEGVSSRQQELLRSTLWEKATWLLQIVASRISWNAMESFFGGGGWCISK